MTLILKLHLDVVKMFHHTKMKLLCQDIQKLYLHLTHTDTQALTHKQYENITIPCTQAVTTIILSIQIKHYYITATHVCTASVTSGE